jgi:hypothetical protein
MASQDDIDAFMGITGSGEPAAQRMFEICGDLEQAVQLWYGDEELQRSLSNPASAAPTASTRSQAQSSRPLPGRRAGREDDRGVIHIDSDEDIDMTENEFDDDDDTSAAAMVARSAQEEEDAAMAKRLQEELYGAGGQDAGEEGVRAPMARTTEMLVAPNYDAPDDVGAAMEEIRQRQAAARGMCVLFSSSPLAAQLLGL